MRLLQEHPHLSLRLAEARDRQGRKAVDVATPQCQNFIRSRLYFYERYDIHINGAKEHQSATCIVSLATDKKNNNREVALKFMKRKDQFEREKSFHTDHRLDVEFVVDMLECHDGDFDAKFLSECSHKGYAGYHYCIVMPAADRTLQRVMAHERVCAREWETIRIMCSQILRALDHLHSNHLVHGDIKPLNIVRAIDDGKFKLIDLDAAADLTRGDFAGLKFSSAFICPEMIHECSVADMEELHQFDNSSSGGGTARAFAVKSLEFFAPSNGGAGADSITEGSVKGPAVPFVPVAAHPSQDMWSFGVVMFQMCSGEPLFIASDEDNLDQKGV